MAQMDTPVRPDESDEVDALRRLAAIAGWCVTSTTGGGHSAGSLHYAPATNGKGRAVDLADRRGPSSSSDWLLAINEAAIRLIPISMISELIYGGPNAICVKDGRRVNRSFYSSVLDAHRNHIHLAVVRGFIYNGGTTPVPVDDPNRQNLNAPCVGGMATPTGKGFWLIGADYGVFAFGDAVYIPVNLEYVKPDNRAWLPSA